MAEQRETLCFECGQPVGKPPMLNRHSDGETCRRCADRVLDSLPPALPRRVEAPEPESDAYEFDLPGNDFVPEDPDEPA